VWGVGTDGVWRVPVGIGSTGRVCYVIERSVEVWRDQDRQYRSGFVAKDLEGIGMDEIIG